VKEENISSRF